MQRLTLAAQWLTILSPLLLLAGPAAQDIGASLLAVLFLAHSAITRNWAWLKWRGLHAVAILWLYLCLRDALGGDIKGFTRSLTFIRYPLFALALIHWTLRDPRTEQRLWLALLAAVLFLLGDSVWQYVMGTDLTGRVRIDWEQGVRLTGPFSNPRVGITILWLAFPLILPLLERRRLWAGFLWAGVTLAIYLSGERMALLLLLLGTGVAMFTSRAYWRLWTGTVAAVLVLGALLSFSQPMLLVRQYDTTRQQAAAFSESNYGQIWQSSWRIWQAHPVFGIGGKQFPVACPQPEYGPTNILYLRCAQHEHNRYLEWLAEYGLVGLALFLLALAHWLRAGWPPRSKLATGLGITLLVILWPISVTPSQFVAWSAIPFWLMLGWWAGRGATDMPEPNHDRPLR